jgi:hypothetical protein
VEDAVGTDLVDRLVDRVWVTQVEVDESDLVQDTLYVGQWAVPPFEAVHLHIGPVGEVFRQITSGEAGHTGDHYFHVASPFLAEWDSPPHPGQTWVVVGWRFIAALFQLAQ